MQISRQPERLTTRGGKHPGVLATAVVAVWMLPICQERVAGEGPHDVPAARDLYQTLATVDDVPIQLGEVRQELRAVIQDRRPEAADEPRLIKEMLQQIVRRRLALAALAAAGRAADNEEVERVLADRRRRFAERGESLEDHLRASGIAETSYRQRLRWELSWAAYKEDVLTDENLRKFFERHRRHFDATEVRASHILLASSGDGDHEKLASELEEIARSIGAGEITFADAAARHSIAPSRDRGGDVGYFPRRGVMHENFSAAAFRLRPGEISPAVVTPFGVHLIQVTDEKPGSKSLAEVRDEVYRAAEARLFETLVASGKKRVEVVYTQ